jgi:Kef-type K+ transport system membrane component KefB
MKGSRKVLSIEIAVLVVLVAVLIGVRRVAPTMAEPSGLLPGQVAMALGFALLAAHLLGRVLSRVALPQITGYLLAGLLLGPYVLGTVSLEVKAHLGIVNQIALGLIALSAGGELRLPEVRPRARAIGWITLFQATLLFAGSAGAVWGAAMIAGWAGVTLPFTQGLSQAQLVVMGLILGLVAAATSPSSTVAVIDEVKARGPMTTLAVGVTVVKDVVVILLMGITLTVARVVLSGGKMFTIGVVGELAGEILISLILGAVVGLAVMVYLARIGREPALFLLVVIFLVVELTHQLEFRFGFPAHFLVVCMTAGFLVENYSSAGKVFMLAIERSSLPVYVVFFTLAGVGLDVGSLRQMWLIALVFIVWRGALTFGTSWGGARLAGESNVIRHYSWTAFLAQAGVSLGLAELVALRYPEMGGRLKTLILAVIALNQIVGPVLFKWALRRSGEAGAAANES